MKPRQHRIGSAAWGNVPRADRQTVIDTMRDDAGHIRDEPMFDTDEVLQRYSDSLDACRVFLTSVERTPGAAARVERLIAANDGFDVAWPVLGAAQRGGAR